MCGLIKSYETNKRKNQMKAWCEANKYKHKDQMKAWRKLSKRR